MFCDDEGENVHSNRIEAIRKVSIDESIISGAREKDASENKFPHENDSRDVFDWKAENAIDYSILKYRRPEINPVIDDKRPRYPETGEGPQTNEPKSKQAQSICEIPSTNRTN